jgi:hypothetical protein
VRGARQIIFQTQRPWSVAVLAVIFVGHLWNDLDLGQPRTLLKNLQPSYSSTTATADLRKQEIRWARHRRFRYPSTISVVPGNLRTAVTFSTFLLCIMENQSTLYHYPAHGVYRICGILRRHYYMLLSISLFHTIANYSEIVTARGVQLDYVGIVLLT